MNWLEPIGVRMAPANFGPMKGADAHARIEGSCGDTMEFWLRMEDFKVQFASFTTDGCETSVAAGAVAAHHIQGKALGEIRKIRPLDLLEILGISDTEAGQEAHHCAELALETIQTALKDYEKALRAAEEASYGCASSCGSGCCEDCQEECADRKQADESFGQAEPGAQGIRKRILVLSGKGGVGKSTVAVNLAMGFAAEGLSTGLLDVDIHGPSVPKLLGLEGEVLQAEGRNLLPVELGNLKVLSMGFALEADQAAIWRGPMKASVIMQFVQKAQWGDTDILVVDCPPGTGDEVLAVAQTLGQVDGVVIVTTPQDLAVLDARKAITFCNALHIPVLGIVENMSGFACPECGTLTSIFRSEGGKHLAEELNLPFLGALPLDPSVGLQGDSGRPDLYRKEETPAGKAFRGLSHQLMDQLMPTRILHH